MEASPQSDTHFEAIFERHYAAVLAYCIRRLPIEDANDAASEVFAVAWRKASSLPDDEATRAWLYGIARNVIRHSYRSTSRRRRLTEKLQGVPTTATAPDPATQVVRSSEDEDLLRALATLREDDQEILRLRIWEELTVPAIARLFDVSTAAAEKRVARALHRLERAVKRTPGHKHSRGGTG